MADEKKKKPWTEVIGMNIFLFIIAAWGYNQTFNQKVGHWAWFAIVVIMIVVLNVWVYSDFKRNYND